MVTLDVNDPNSFSVLDDDELNSLIVLAIDEQKRRALENGDVNALIENGFDTGFMSNALVKDPVLRDGLLVCFGTRVDKSGTSHLCSFVRVQDAWVWEYEDLIEDSVRNIPGPKATMRSVSVVPAFEGMEVDLIHSRTRTGIHEMVKAKSFVVKNGELAAVNVRARKSSNHR